MSINSTNVPLLIVVIGIFALNWLLKPDITQRNYEFLPEMVYSVPYDTYSDNPVFPDGKTLQRPVEGTIPRGTTPLHYQATKEDAERAGRELSNPFGSDDMAAKNRGANLFRTYCAICHDKDGTGHGPVVKRGYPAPPSLLSDKAKAMPAGQMYHLLTYGQGNMPGYAVQVMPVDRWRTILYVQNKLQQSAKVTPTENKQHPADQPAAGEVVQ